jgi:membrane-bound inhibitor of C-type lysozyme
MNFKNIDWNHVTKYSQVAAIVLFVGVFALGFWLGKVYEYHAFQNSLINEFGLNRNTGPVPSKADGPSTDVTYTCPGNKFIRAIYSKDSVELYLSDGRHIGAPHAMSADGARYANKDESFVFWNKGTTAFITEGKGAAATTTFADCDTKPAS